MGDDRSKKTTMPVTDAMVTTVTLQDWDKNSQRETGFLDNVIIVEPGQSLVHMILVAVFMES